MKITLSPAELREQIRSLDMVELTTVLEEIRGMARDAEAAWDPLDQKVSLHWCRAKHYLEEVIERVSMAERLMP